MKSTWLSLAIAGAMTAGVTTLAQNAPPATPQAAAPAAPGAGQAPARGRGPGNPTRDPHNPAYVKAKELPDGTIPTANDEGNFIIGATHPAAPEMTAREDVPHGTINNFEMQSTDSKIYPGIA